MTDAAATPGVFVSFDCDRAPPRASSRAVLVAGMLAAATVAAACWLDGPRSALPDAATAARATLADAMARPPARPVAVLARAAVPPAAVAPGPDAALLDPSYALGPAPAPFARSLPLASRFASLEMPAVEPKPHPLPSEAAAPGPAASASAEAPAALEAAAPLPPAIPDASPLAALVPLPTPRPADPRWPSNREIARAPAARMAQRNVAPASAGPASSPPGDDRGFLERFFGVSRPSGAPGPSLAYASPEDGAVTRGFGWSPQPPQRSSGVAIYDIAAHTVTLPDGSRLEAHSGLGDLLDDPRHVDARNRGATPPHVYDLSLREQPFHGVQALRLTPVGGGGVFGRTGLLAHTFMLGARGDSNGCVSFRDYGAFLQAYRSGLVRRLVVVAGA